MGRLWPVEGAMRPIVAGQLVKNAGCLGTMP